MGAGTGQQTPLPSPGSVARAFAVLVQIDGDLELTGVESTHVVFETLTTVGGAVKVLYNTGLVSLGLPALTRVGYGGLLVHGNDLLTSIDAYIDEEVKEADTAAVMRLKRPITLKRVPGSSAESHQLMEDLVTAIDVYRDEAVLEARAQRQVQRRAQTMMRWTQAAWNAAMRAAHGNG